MASVDRSSPIPLYVQLKDILAARIESAEWQPGDRIPSGLELQKTYGLSRITVRRALAELVNAGLLDRQRGRGTFVTWPKIVHNPALYTSLTDRLLQQGMEPGWQILDVTWVPLTSQVGKQLQIANDTEVLRIRRLRLANDRPIGYHTAYLAAQFVQQIDKDALTEGGSLHYLHQLPQFAGSEAPRTVEAIAAGKEEAMQLGVKSGAPVLLIERVIISADNVPIEYLRAAYRGDRFKYHISL